MRQVYLQAQTHSEQSTNLIKYNNADCCNHLYILIKIKGILVNVNVSF